ncbi:MAG: DNA replication/repair protein RecF [Acidimicrobiales bacterium]
MRLSRLWLTDFRNYTTVTAELSAGLTVITGMNGQGKSNLLESVGYLCRLESYRGSPPEAMVRSGAPRAVIRGEGTRAGRDLVIEAEILVRGRGRARLNGQPLARADDPVNSLAATIFASDDLDLVRGSPAGRRQFLDDLAVGLWPGVSRRRADLERVLRQRTALLRQLAANRHRSGSSRPALNQEEADTLAVWDAALVEAGEAMGRARAETVGRLGPEAADAYDQLAVHQTPAPPAPTAWTRAAMTYEAPWRAAGLGAALAEVREEELRRGVCLAGPHRDDLTLNLGDLAARTQASGGEQRTLALALRLGAHRLLTARLGEPPLLLLDDVFSELDAARSASLMAHLPAGQVVLATTGALPPGARPQRVLRAAAGRLVEAGPTEALA